MTGLWIGAWRSVLTSGLVSVLVCGMAGDRGYGSEATPMGTGSPAAGPQVVSLPANLFVVTPQRTANTTVQLTRGQTQTLMVVFVGTGQYEFTVTDSQGQRYAVVWTYVDLQGRQTQTSVVNPGDQLTVGVAVSVAGFLQVTIADLARLGDPADTYTVQVQLMTP